MIKRLVARAIVVLMVVLLSGAYPSSVHAAGGDLGWAYDAALPAKQDVRSAAFDSTGCVVLVGADGEGAASNGFVAKLAADGQSLAWSIRSFDLSGGVDVATAVVVDGEDNIIVAGYGHNGSNYDIQTIKYRGSDGSVLWQHTYNGPAAGDDIATAIGIDSFYNVYVGGYTQGVSGKDDFIILKYQQSGPVNGAPLWVQTINGNAGGNDRLMALAVKGSSLAVTGESESGTVNDFDLLVHKFHLDGSDAWIAPKLYADSGNGEGLAVALDAAENVLVTGYVDTGSRAMYTAKYAAADGGELWAKLRPGQTVEGGHALVVDANNDVFVTGTSYSASSSYDIYTVKYQGTDPLAGVPVTLWEDIYNTTNGNQDIGLALTLDSGGDLYVAAYSNNAASGDDDVVTVKYAGGDGARLWPLTNYDLAGMHDRPVAIGIAPSGAVLVGGWSETAANNNDFVALSYDAGAVNQPTELKATVISNSEIHLSWTDNSTEDHFVLERRTESSGSFSEIVTLGAGVTSYNNTGLTHDVRYHYRVKATSLAEGSSAWSNIANARTTVINYAAPSWMHLFAGNDQGDDDPNAIAVGADQHPVVTGASFALVGGYDYLTLKLDRADASSEQWQARYNDGDNEGDTAISVAIDSQDRVVVTGYSSLYGGGSSNTNDIYTLGYPVNGPPNSWSDQYNGPAGNDDKSSAVATAIDGSDNSVVVGYGKNLAFNNDIYVLKYAPDGTRLWAAVPFDGGDEDKPAAAAFDSLGNVFVVGRSFNGSDDDWFVARYAAVDGTRTHLAPLHLFSGNGNDYAEALAIDAAGDVYVTGYADNGSNGDIYTVKFSGSDLSILWQQAADAGGYDHGADIGIDPVNGDILVAGTSFMGPGNHDFRLLRYTAAGNAGAGEVVWNHQVDLAGTDDSLTAMAIDHSGVASLTGSSEDDILTVKVDHTELIVGANVFDGPAGGLDYPVDIAVNDYGEAFVAGSSMNADVVPNTDFLVFRVDGKVLPAPSPVSATQLYAEVSLGWADNDLDGLGFRLERKLNGCASSDPWLPVGSFAATETSAVDTPVNVNTSYCYRVQSFSAADESRWVQLQVMTADPVAPSGLSASLLNDSDIQLSWTDNTPDAKGYDFHIERCSGVSCDFSSATSTVVSAAVVTDPETGLASWVDTTACSGGLFRYRVRADKPGLWTSVYSSPTAATGIAPIAPGAPSDLIADRASETTVDLHWTDNSDGESSFIIERCDADAASCASGPWNVLGVLPAIPGTLLHLRMDEALWDGTADEVVDLSGLNNHGTASGAVVTPYGRFGSSGSYRRNSDHVMTPLIIDQSDTTTGATFSAWVRPQGSGGQFYLFGTDDGGNDWGVLHNGSTWQLATGADSGLQDTGVSVDLNSWQHIAASFDKSGGIKLYKNGTEAWADSDVDPLTPAGIDFDASSGPLVIGLETGQPDALLNLNLDEQSWTDGTPDVSDSSSSGNHGTSYNLTPVAEGKFGGAAAFDGVSSYISTPLNIDQSDGFGGLTMEIWAYPTDNTSTYRHVISTDAGSNDWGIYQYGGGWRIMTGWYGLYKHPVDLNTWQHLVVVYDPAVGMTFYKNGVAAATDGFYNSFSTADNNVTIGRSASGAFYSFKGNLDGVTIYDRALSSAEVVQRYQKSAFVGEIDEVAVFGRPLGASEISSLHQHGIDRYSDASAAINSDYSYRVSADKPGSCASDWPTAPSAILSTSPAPPAPELTVSAEDLGRIRLDWRPLTTTQDGFKVERCETGGCLPGILLDDSLAASATTYLDAAVCSGQSYRYQVTATDAVWGESAPSNIVEATIPAMVAATGLSVSALTEGTAGLEWVYPDPDASGFKVGYCSGSCLQPSDFTLTDSSGLPAGAQLQLKMDETVWSNGSAGVVDGSGADNHGTPYNGAVPVSSGRFGWSGSFDGINDYVQTPLTINQSDSGTGATFEAWVYPTIVDTSWRFVISTENGGNDWGVIHYNGYWYVSTGSNWLNTGIAVDVNQWQHITASFEPGVATKFYKNGGQVPADIYSSTNIGTDTSSYPVNVGRRANGSFYYAGRVDEVVVYTQVLSAEQVLGRYQQRRFASVGVLTPEQNYTFRVWPLRNDPCGSTGGSIDYNDPVATTTAAVAPPTNLIATTVGSTRVDLSWVIQTRTQNLIRVERCSGTQASCGTADANFVDLSVTEGTLAANAVSYRDLTLCAESAYTYRVRSERDQAPLWASDWSYVERAAQVLSAVGNFQASSLSESEILLSWDDTTPDETAYILERCPGPVFNCGTPTTVNTQPESSAVFHFDEAAWVNGVADVFDADDSARHATSFTGAKTLEDGRFARGGDFTATDDYLTTPVVIDQSVGSRGATFQAWVYPTGTPASYAHVVSTENGGYDWSLVHYNGYWYVFNGNSAYATGKTVDMNQWQHVAAVFDPAAGIQFYKNGGVLPADVYTSTNIGFDDSSASVTIGRYASSSSASYNFIGRIDEVVMTERPLSADEIKANYLYPYHSYIDTGLLTGTSYSYRLSAVKQETLSNPEGCDWSVSAETSAATLAPPAPESLAVSGKSTTSIDLSWLDKSGSESDYQLQRCPGSLATCAGLDANYNPPDFPSVDLPADSESYQDECAAVDTLYSYRVRARKAPYVPPGWETSWVYLETRTDALVDLANFSINRVSEVQIDLSWDDANSDESGFIIDRCSGSGCDFSVKDSFIVSDPSTHVIYSDAELQPKLIYNYRVRAYKTVPCTNVADWYTNYAGPLEAAVTVAAPNLLSATEISTTQIDLVWTSNAPSATGTAVERCNGHPCVDAYVPLGTANIAANSFNDLSACQNSSYSYRIKSVGEQLSNDGAGCWSRRARINISSFSPGMVFALDVPAAADMRSDFADLRFFDETARRELLYWIEEIIDPGLPTAVAKVQVAAGSNDDIYLYYGNVTAADSSNREAFVYFEDNFTGNQIDGAKWLDLDAADFIVQNDGLHLSDLVNYGTWSGLISVATFDRTKGLELLVDLDVPADSDGLNYFAFGWEKDQSASSAMTNRAHTFYGLNNYEFQVYENGVVKDPGVFRFYPNTRYQFRVIVAPVAGADYYMKGGSLTDWTLVTKTTSDASPYSGSPLRLNIMQNTQNATFNFVQVRKAIDLSSISLGAEENIGGCYSPGYSWESDYSVEDVWETTRSAVAPTLDSAVALNDTTVELHWTNHSDADAGFDLERCCGSGCSFALIANIAPGVTQYIDTVAPASSSCGYQLFSSKTTPDCSWSVGPSNVLSVDTFAAAPSGLLAVAENSRLVRLQWNDQASDEDGFELQVRQGEEPYRTTANIAADLEFLFDGRNIEPERTYAYRIRSFRRVGSVEPYTYEWSAFSYSNLVTTPAWTSGDATCAP